MREIMLVVWSVRRAVKYIVSRHMNQWDSKSGGLCGKIVGTHSVNGVSAGDLRLRPVDIIEGGGINDEIGRLALQNTMDLA
jgi:hypothetical protein